MGALLSEGAFEVQRDATSADNAGWAGELVARHEFPSRIAQATDGIPMPVRLDAPILIAVAKDNEAGALMIVGLVGPP